VLITDPGRALLGGRPRQGLVTLSAQPRGVSDSGAGPGAKPGPRLSEAHPVTVTASVCCARTPSACQPDSDGHAAGVCRGRGGGLGRRTVTGTPPASLLVPCVRD
jgi:hypothetical protein